MKSAYLFIILLFAPNIILAEETCKKIFNIGVSLPLTSRAVFSGEVVKKSIILADEKHDTNNCVNFIFEDDQLQPKYTLNNINKFINIYHVDGLIVYGTPTAISVGSIVERSKTPMIALSILPKVVDGKKYIMKHWCTSEKLNNAITAESKAKGYKKIAIISTENEAMLGLRDLFKNSSSSNIVLDESYSFESNDFRSSILKIINNQAEAVYILLYPPQTGMFVKQIRELGFTGDLFGAHNFEDPNEVKVSNNTMLGSWFANGDDTLGQNYIAEFKQRFNSETALGGASGYDSAKMFIEASYQDKVDINSYIHNLKDFVGAFGKYNSTPNNDFDFQAVIKVVTRDGFKMKDLD